MSEIYLDIREWNKWFKDRFPNKDFISLEELLNDYEELIFDKEHLEEELSDLQNDLESNYKPISVSEQVNVYDNDFI